MKKFLILLLVAGLFGFTSCSDDDDETSDDGKRIVGVWTLVSVSPENDLLDPSSCETPSVLELQNDGTAEGTFYISSNSCNASEVTDGSWEYIGNSNYTIDLPTVGTQEGTVEFDGNNAFTFNTIITYEGFAFPVEFSFTK